MTSQKNPTSLIKKLSVLYIVFNILLAKKHAKSCKLFDAFMMSVSNAF